MSARCLGILAVTVVLGFSSASAQSCRVSPVAVLELFDLADAFGDGVSLRPFDEASAFPWWVFGGDSEPLAVVENVYAAESAGGYLVFLDAQYLDGNDLIVSEPVSARQIQRWSCAGGR